MTASKIEWCDRSDWNPIRGCTRESAGCRNCYAERIAARFSDPGQPFHGIAERTKSGPHWTGKMTLVEDRLDLPLRWKKPSRIFANSMFDLFAEGVPDEWIDRVFAVMALAQHTFLVLTKRAQRMREYLTAKSHAWDAGHACGRVAILCEQMRKQRGEWNGIGPVGHLEPGASWWPLANVWLGVSVEDQARADERIPALLATPAATRFLSAEPLLGPVDLTRIVPPRFRQADENDPYFAYDAVRGHAIGPDDIGLPRLDWVIVGGESGAGARPMHPDWLRSIVAQCRAADVACFVKQLGSNPTLRGFTGAPLKDRKGGDWSEWPDDLRVRQFPEVRNSQPILSGQRARENASSRQEEKGLR